MESMILVILPPKICPTNGLWNLNLWPTVAPSVLPASAIAHHGLPPMTPLSWPCPWGAWKSMACRFQGPLLLKSETSSMKNQPTPHEHRLMVCLVVCLVEFVTCASLSNDPIRRFVHRLLHEILKALLQLFQRAQVFGLRPEELILSSLRGALSQKRHGYPALGGFLMGFLGFSKDFLGVCHGLLDFLWFSIGGFTVGVNNPAICLKHCRGSTRWTLGLRTKDLYKFQTLSYNEGRARKSWFRFNWMHGVWFVWMILWLEQDLVAHTHILFQNQSKPNMTQKRQQHKTTSKNKRWKDMKRPKTPTVPGSYFDSHHQWTSPWAPANAMWCPRSSKPLAWGTPPTLKRQRWGDSQCWSLLGSKIRSK